MFAVDPVGNKFVNELWPQWRTTRSDWRSFETYKWTCRSDCIGKCPFICFIETSQWGIIVCTAIAIWQQWHATKRTVNSWPFAKRCRTIDTITIVMRAHYVCNGNKWKLHKQYVSRCALNFIAHTKTKKARWSRSRSAAVSANSFQFAVWIVDSALPPPLIVMWVWAEQKHKSHPSIHQFERHEEEKSDL